MASGVCSDGRAAPVAAAEALMEVIEPQTLTDLGVPTQLVVRRGDAPNPPRQDRAGLLRRARRGVATLATAAAGAKADAEAARLHRPSLPLVHTARLPHRRSTPSRTPAGRADGLISGVRHR